VDSLVVGKITAADELLLPSLTNPWNSFVWQRAIAGPFDHVSPTACLIPGDGVVTGTLSISREVATFYKFDAVTGAVVWSRQFTTTSIVDRHLRVCVSPTYDSIGGFVFVQIGSAYARLDLATGTVSWSRQTTWGTASDPEYQITDETDVPLGWVGIGFSETDNLLHLHGLLYGKLTVVYAVPGTGAVVGSGATGSAISTQLFGAPTAVGYDAGTRTFSLMHRASGQTILGSISAARTALEHTSVRSYAPSLFDYPGLVGPRNPLFERELAGGGLPDKETIAGWGFSTNLNSAATATVGLSDFWSINVSTPEALFNTVTLEEITSIDNLGTTSKSAVYGATIKSAGFLYFRWLAHIVPSVTPRAVGYQINGVETVLTTASSLGGAWAYAKVPVAANDVVSFFLYHLRDTTARTALLVDNLTHLTTPDPIFVTGLGDSWGVRARQIGLLSGGNPLQVTYALDADLKETRNKLSLNGEWTTVTEIVFPQPVVENPVGHISSAIVLPSAVELPSLETPVETVAIVPTSPWWVSNPTQVTGALDTLTVPRPAVSVRGVTQVEALRVFGVAKGTATPVPPSAQGLQGDLAGDIRFDATFMYYCYRDFDGLNSCWVRTPLETWTPV
jgi:hypothetical protein